MGWHMTSGKTHDLSKIWGVQSGGRTKVAEHARELQCRTRHIMGETINTVLLFATSRKADRTSST